MLFVLVINVLSLVKAIPAEPEDLVLWASPKYDPGTRDFTHKFAESLAKHRNEPMSNAEYSPNPYPDNPYDPNEGINNWDDEHKAPELLAKYSPYWNPRDGIERHPVLIMEDMENGYQKYVDFVIPRCATLLKIFREKDWPIIWTNWVRLPDDKAYGALDRFYGPQGVGTEENAVYVYGPRPTETLPELSPSNDDEFRRTIKSLHLSKFADFDKDGNSILYPRLKQWGVDTIVLAGAWTDDCILATVYDAADKYGFDTILVEDAVATTTHNHGNALKVAGEGLAYVAMVEDVLDYANTPGVFAQSPGYRNSLQFIEQSPLSRASNHLFSSSSASKSNNNNNNINNAAQDDAYLFPKLRPSQTIDYQKYSLNSPPTSITVSLSFFFGLIVSAALLAGFVTALLLTNSHHRRLQNQPYQHQAISQGKDSSNQDHAHTV